MFALLTLPYLTLLSCIYHTTTCEQVNVVLATVECVAPLMAFIALGYYILILYCLYFIEFMHYWHFWLVAALHFLV